MPYWHGEMGREEGLIALFSWAPLRPSESDEESPAPLL